jgi:hypothetical protein
MEELTTPLLDCPFDTPPLLMEQLLAFVQSQDVFAWLGALVALLSAVIAVASLIPGDEPENTLQKIVDFLSKFSRK